jgi:hypothetical protein
MEAEVTEIVGPKGKHNPERTAKRHGHERGSMTLGGRRVEVSRPRAIPVIQLCHLPEDETSLARHLRQSSNPQARELTSSWSFPRAVSPLAARWLLPRTGGSLATTVAIPTGCCSWPRAAVRRYY